MALFESLVLLLFVSALLLAGSRRLRVPYPTLLSVAGIGCALLPFAPSVEIEPHLALAIFIAPALLSAAYDTGLRELRALWAPLLALAVGAVLATTAVVALIGWWAAGLPIAAAIALGAVVAPPDAAAASAVLSQAGLPRRSVLVLQGESLLNDATALLIFGIATALVGGAVDSAEITQLALAVPGGLIVGLVLAWLYLRLSPLFEGTLSAVVVQFTTTFGVWLVAERLHLSPVLAVVAYAMTIARHAPSRQSARDRVQSYAVWGVVVFVLNVLAFLLMGLQARDVVEDLGRDVAESVLFALAILAVVIVTRLVSVLGYRALSGWVWRVWRPAWLPEPQPWHTSLVVGWCGMRGLLTLATAFALPQDFPRRDLIVLTAFAVVIGTLVIQGLTLGPLMRALGVDGDEEELGDELARARRRMLDAGRAAAEREEPEVAKLLGAKLDAARAVTRSNDDPQGPTAFDSGLARVVEAQREELHELRDAGGIADDVFHRLEEELDWLEMSARPNRELEVTEA